MVIAKKQFNTTAPFGVATKRFLGIGFHPDLVAAGPFAQKTNNLGPGQYNPLKYECAYRRDRTRVSSWTRELDAEEFSSNLGFRCANILAKKRHSQGCLGPGTYEINDDFKLCSKLSSNLGFGIQKRFFRVNKNSYPAPGTYIKRSSTAAKRTFSSLPTFERDGFLNRFKNNDSLWTVAPNHYSPKYANSIDALLAKVVSSKGPYNLFTGPRNESTIKNHFATPCRYHLDNFITYPSELDNLLHHPNRNRYGRFLQAKRFGKPTSREMISNLVSCHRDPREPDPASYFIPEY